MKYGYDLLGHRVYQNSMDAGKRWMLNNVMGNPVKTWDGRDHIFSFAYDDLQRPSEMKVEGGDSDIPLNNIYEKIIYGEGQTDDKRYNLRGQVFEHFDTAGKLQFVNYDFKGNLLKSTRNLTKDYKNVVNWSNPNPDDLLETETFISEFKYDAINRVTWSKTPDDSVTEPGYNEANLLETVSVAQNSSSTLFVKNIDYDEKGQRQSITYGNDVITTYDYDKETFRLLHLQTKRANNDLLQDLHYTYDPVGNITEIDDRAIPTIFFNNHKIEPKSKYTYDPLYRLIEAEGKEHIAQTNFGAEDNWNDLPFLKQYSAGDPMAWRTYTQKYTYDAVGNIEQMQHIANAGSWTRNYEYETLNNRLKKTQVGSDVYTYHHHPQHGFMEAMPHLQVMKWNFKDELQEVARQRRTDGGTPETTYYIYDSGGQRMRKVTENTAEMGTMPRKKNDRIYIDGTEIYRDYQEDGSKALERKTMHVMDDTRRIALVETLTQTSDNLLTRTFRRLTGSTGDSLVRYQISNHLNTASLETDNTGEIITYEEYHPFGTTSYQAIDKDIEAAAKRYRYTGKERDEESGFYYYGIRYYLPYLGLWCSPDPDSLIDGINQFRYARVNPINFVDVGGYKSVSAKKLHLIYYGGTPTVSHLGAFKWGARNLKNDLKRRYKSDRIEYGKISSAKDIVERIGRAKEGSIATLNIFSHSTPFSMNFYGGKDKNVGFYTGNIGKNLVEAYYTAPKPIREKGIFSTALWSIKRFFSKLLFDDDLGRRDYKFTGNARSVSDIDYTKFTDDALIELHGCLAGTDTSVFVDSLAEEMSELLYDAGKEEAVVIAHVTKSNPNIRESEGKKTRVKEQDYRHRERVVYHRGAELFRTTQKGEISRELIQQHLGAKKNANIFVKIINWFKEVF